MSEKAKILLDTIAEVHRAANIKKQERVNEAAQEIVDEGVLDTAGKVVAGGISAAKKAMPIVKNIAKNVVGGFKGFKPVGLPQTAETLPGKSAAQIAAAFPQKAGPVSTGASAVGAAIKKGTDAVSSVAAKPAAQAAAGGAAVGSALTAAITKKDDSKASEGGTSVVAKDQSKPAFDAPKSAPAGPAPAPKTDSTPEAPKEKKTFGQAFAAARKEAGGGDGKFSFGGKDFQTNVKGEKYKTPDKLKATSVKEENMTSPLIDSFLKLQGLKSSNMFEAAKKLDPRGGDTVGSGTVTSGGKDVVSKTAPKASTTGPSDADKKALTDKIKTITKEEVETVEEAKKEGYQNWPGEKKKAFKNGPKDKDGKTETQKWAEKKKAEKECTKEEVEQIDELSKKTLGSYVKKASSKLSSSSYNTGKGHYGTNPFDHKYAKETKKQSNRQTGINRAVDKLTKEDVEFSEAELAHFESLTKTEE